MSLHLLTDYDVIGGIAHAEMMDRTNLVALVAGGAAPRFPDRNGEDCNYQPVTTASSGTCTCT